MIKFCPGCGASLPGPVSFCAQCGRRIEGAAPVQSSYAGSPQMPPQRPEWSAAQVPPPRPVPQQRSTGLGKILLIALIVIGVILAGIVGAGYYAVHRVKQKVAQVRAEYGAEEPTVTGRAALGGRSVCDLLGNAEFRRITGVVVTESVPTESGSELTCEYFSTPKEAARRKPVRAEEIQNAQQALDAVQSAMSQAANHAPVLRVTIHLANAKAMMLGSRLATGVTTENSRIANLGDEAYMDATGSMLAARKGKRGVMLTMPLLPNSRTTGPLIAKKILDQI